MKWYSDENSFYSYLEITDEQLKRVREDRYYFNDIDFVNECVAARGRNVLVMQIFNRGGKRAVLAGLRRFQKEYKSVSFWGRGHDKFFSWDKR